MTVVMDQLNTHTLAALYAAFPPAEARRLCAKLQIRHTPKHGSWLNMAECAFVVLHRHCVDRRLGNQAAVAREIHAWEEARNAANATITWQFTVTQARKKLHRLYPSKPA